MLFKCHLNKLKSTFLFLAFALVLLFSSCSDGINRRSTTVKFVIDSNTVQKIVSNTKTPDSSRSARAADDTEQQDGDDENETIPVEVYDFLKNLYIDVTLYAEEIQTKTEQIKDVVNIEFEDVPIGAKVYATAQIYEYINPDQDIKFILYRGSSEPIFVRDRANVLTVKMGKAGLSVTFETNGGSPVEAQTVMTGDFVQVPETDPVKPEVPVAYSRENYAFGGWYADEDLTTLFDFASPVYDDITIYAKWLSDFVVVKGDTVQDSLASGRKVKISDLYVSDHEVTQAEYLAIAKTNPAYNTSDAAENLPVENVSWFDAIVYCNKRSIAEGFTPCYTINGSTDPEDWTDLKDDTSVACNIYVNGYRLPTESEWDYIAQKAKRTNVEFSKLAWYGENGDNRTHVIKYKLADELCLCDLLGNVAEWCFDWYSADVGSAGANGPMSGTSRVIRGGSYQTQGDQNVLMAVRSSSSPTSKNNSVGFRVVRTLVDEFKIVKNKVVFDPNGGSSVDVQVVVKGGTAEMPEDPEKTGYDFKGWRLNGVDFDFLTPITDDIILTAAWTPKRYRISYELNGAEWASGFEPPYEHIYGEEVYLPVPQKVVLDGYGLTGWYKESDFSGTSITVIEAETLGDLKFYAQLIPGATTYNVYHYQQTVDGTDYEKVETENIPGISEQTTTAAAKTYTGFTVVTPIDQKTISGDGSTEVIIRYNRNKYTITYNDGTEGENLSNLPAAAENIYYGSRYNVVFNSTFTRTGYTFTGWENSITGVMYNEGTGGITSFELGASDVTLIAHWAANTNTQYTVIHRKQKVDGSGYGEGNANSEFVEVETKTGTTKDPTAATPKSYTGFVEPDYSDITQLPINPDGSTVIEITYDRQTFKVTYYDNAPTGAGAVTSMPTDSTFYRYEQSINIQNVTPACTGYTFKGWSTSANDSGTLYNYGGTSPTMGETGLTLYAQWEQENQNTGIDVGFGVDTGVITVSEPTGSSTIFEVTDVAGEGISPYTYVWTVDGATQSGITIQLDMASIATVPGVYDITLTATNKSDSSKVYTWTGQFVKN